MWFVAAKKLENHLLEEINNGCSDIDLGAMRNIYFKYFDRPRELIDDLLQLHMYRNTMPTIVIIDHLHTFFDSPEITDNEFMQKHMLIAASLHSSIESLTKCLQWDCFSVLCIDTMINPLYERFKQIFIDSYFIESENIFTSSSDLLKEIKTTVVFNANTTKNK